MSQADAGHLQEDIATGARRGFAGEGVVEINIGGFDHDFAAEGKSEASPKSQF